MKKLCSAPVVVLALCFSLNALADDSKKPVPHAETRESACSGAVSALSIAGISAGTHAPVSSVVSMVVLAAAGAYTWYDAEGGTATTEKSLDSLGNVFEGLSKASEDASRFSDRTVGPTYQKTEDASVKGSEKTSYTSANPSTYKGQKRAALVLVAGDAVQYLGGAAASPALDIAIQNYRAIVDHSPELQSMPEFADLSNEAIAREFIKAAL